MRPISAVIFDLDGTLYLQKPVQRSMMARLLRAALRRPVEGLRHIRILSAYRQAQEDLRDHTPSTDLAAKQLEMAARRSGVNSSVVSTVVEHWMQRSPLPLLASNIRSGTLEMLNNLKSQGIRLGLLSDYPAEAKLDAMGITRCFDVIACAQDREINRFKPDPHGLRVVLKRLQVDADQALYVGDRLDVDGEAARWAGVDVVIVCGKDWSPLETRLAVRGVVKSLESIPECRSECSVKD